MLGRAAQHLTHGNPASAHPAAASSTSAADSADGRRLEQRFREARRRTAQLCEPLLTEDFCVQSMPDVSPPKWHLAHASWFFEQFILIPYSHGYQPYHRLFGQLFNSYYKSVGHPWDRSRRGVLSRPGVDEVYRYRAHVEENLLDLLSKLPAGASPEVWRRLELGIQHEQQHQELLLTDILHIFWSNPLRPVYRSLPGETRARAPRSARHELRWVAFEGGTLRIGADETAFAFDNELPRHLAYLDPFELASRPVACGELLAFMEDYGYARPELWLADGWDAAQRGAWNAPLYWEKRGRSWWRMTLHGMCPVMEDEPACHVSFYEADAFARWKGARLPTEAEWEIAATALPVEGDFVESGTLWPLPAAPAVQPVQQLFGGVWEWTASPYRPYPGFRAAAGPLGEYNGKFMCNQMVLRGGSCASPASHLRASYRNFFPPDARWQFSGIRLAR